MKLVALLSEVRRFGAMARVFATYPGQLLHQKSLYFLERRMQEIDLPIGENSPAHNHRKGLGQRLKERAKHYEKKIGSPKSQQPNQNKVPSAINKIDEIPEHIPSEEIPALKEGQEIRGRKGRYKCSGEIIRQGEYFRVYRGVRIQNNQPVLIKEYLLFEKNFNQQERQDCQERFAYLADINLRTGSSRDFRIVTPYETIAPPREKRCYLITEPIDNSISLREYLKKQASITPQEIVTLLDLILQTLWFLHTNRICLFSGEIEKGIAHGNLDLDSILIVVNENYSKTEEPQLFAYLSDLALWEHLFIPPNSPIIKTSFQQDSIDLGTVCFYLLSGRDTEPKTGQLLSPRDEENWPGTDIPLENFIKRLLRLNGQFESALAARQELLKLLDRKQFEFQTARLKVREENDFKGHGFKVNKIAAASIAFGILAAIGVSFYLLFNRPAKKQVLTYGDNQDTDNISCCLNKVEIPNQKHAYAVDDALWGYVFGHPGVVSQNKTLSEELELRDPRLANYKLTKSSLKTLEALKKGEIDFVLTRWHKDLPAELEQKVVAYHGLVVFVAFSDEKRQQNIPKALGGKISLEGLRGLYTGATKNWKVPKNLKDWDVKLYVPFEAEAIDLFEELLFDRKDSIKINDYKNQVAAIQLRQIKELQKEHKYRVTTRYLLEEILQDFENKQTLSIGFSFLSTIFGQCAVYPIGVETENKVIQTLAKTNGDPISSTVDLCNDKGGYWPNVNAFKVEKYPLGYSLVVLYRRDRESSLAGNKFAELLKTDEGQYLLREAGLVPLRNLE